MKHKKILVYILVLALLLPCLPMAGHAAQEIGFGLSVTPETAAFGSQTTVTVSLTGYNTAAIAGLQVDITGFDADVLQVAEYASLIQDTAAESNTVSYSEAQNRVRLLYFRTSGTLAPCTDVLKLVLRIDPALTQAGSITLPVTVKIVTEDSRQITLTSSCTIGYGDISAAAGNSTTGAVYGTLAEALEAAEEGQTVQLLSDCEENLLVVPANVTFDLNGYVVETSNVVSFGAVIDTAAEAGGIRIDFDTANAFTKLQEKNAGYLPIYDTNDGTYKFFAYELVNKGSKEANGAAKFGIAILFENPEAYKVLADTANSGITLMTELTWTGMTVPSVSYVIPASAVKLFAQNVYTQLTTTDRAEPTYAITLTVSGLSSLKTGSFVAAAPSISTIAEVGTANEAIVYTLP